MIFIINLLILALNFYAIILFQIIMFLTIKFFLKISVIISNICYYLFLLNINFSFFIHY